MPNPQSKSPRKPPRKTAQPERLKVIWKRPARHYTTEELSPLIDILAAVMVREILEDDAKQARNQTVPVETS